MKKASQYEPIKIKVNIPEDLFDIHRRDISKAIINAMKYGYTKRIKTVDFAEVNFADHMFVNLAIDTTEYDHLIDKNIQILEEFEEYEICADALKLKKKLDKKNKKKDLEN